MKILILGGTGAMGRPLVKLLSTTDNTVYVTSRGKHHSTEKVRYIRGNARDISFLKKTLSEFQYDVIVDFMVWTSDFEKVLPILLSATSQYIFISSARVYAQSENPITEETPRLLDVSEDNTYLQTNEYALAKAREEDLLLHSGFKNYTIVRPSITYNTHRLQLGVLEKESWLYRTLHGRSIVFSHDIANKLTTMTLGDDVAMGIASLFGQKNALGQAFHITYPQSLLWSDVLDIYIQVLEKHLGHSVKVTMTEKSTSLNIPSRIYQVIYCRYFNRTFDNSKISHYCDMTKFTSPDQGLAICLEKFLEKPHFHSIDWQLEAYNDRAANERTPLQEIPGLGNKIHYVTIRYNLQWATRIFHLVVSILRKLRNIIK